MLCFTIWEGGKSGGLWEREMCKRNVCIEALADWGYINFAIQAPPVSAPSHMAILFALKILDLCENQCICKGSHRSQPSFPKRQRCESNAVSTSELKFSFESLTSQTLLFSHMGRRKDWGASWAAKLQTKFKLFVFIFKTLDEKKVRECIDFITKKMFIR